MKTGFIYKVVKIFKKFIRNYFLNLLIKPNKISSKRQTGICCFPHSFLICINAFISARVAIASIAPGFVVV